MKKITFLFVFTLFSVGLYAQCPIPATSFVGDYNLIQVTPIHPENSVLTFENQVVSLSIGADENNRVFSALFLEGLGIANQTPMNVSFTLDCSNGDSVVVDNDLDTVLTCSQIDNITMGPAPSAGTFDEDDDSSFTLILYEYVNNGGCAVPAPLVTEFTLTKATCAAPQSLAVDNITDTSADVSWSDPTGTVSTFDVEYGLEGFAIGSGTVIAGLPGTSATLPNLEQGNFYDVYITSMCGTDTSIAAGPLNFLVPSDCGATYSGFPLVENFENAADFASCYTIIDQDANGNAWIRQELALDNTSPENLSFFSTNGSSLAQKEDYLISPAIALTAGNTYDISFIYNGANAANGQANENLEVLVAQGTTVADANAGTSIFTDTGIMQNGELAEVENEALTGSGQFTPTTSGDYNLVFKSTGSPLPGAVTTGFMLLFNYTIDETLSADTFEVFDFDYFVDVQNRLNLSANQAFEKVSLFNLSGQRVLSEELNSQNEKIDLNMLTKGVYLASVQINGTTKTFKLIKR